MVGPTVLVHLNRCLPVRRGALGGGGVGAAVRDRGRPTKATVRLLQAGELDAALARYR